MLTGGVRQQGAEEIGSGIFELWVRGLLGLTSCEERELENVEWTVASVFSVLVLHTKANYTLPIQSAPQFICAIERS